MFERAWLDRFLALLPPGAPVLDLGCGMAEPIAAYVIERGHPVTGVDGAPAMIALCRARFPAQRWIVADVRGFHLGETFAGLLAWDSLFHLPPDQQRAMFPVFGRHVGPGGALMFTSGPHHGIAMGEFEGEPLYHASLDAAEYQTLLHSHGFDVLAHRVEDPGCGDHTVWLARRRDQ
ncbi:MAG TPA: class I SAM-dependent methyltransferase [Acetobacteraceae bacterium]|nr:class I SAM-dependent methyltransferase [Acetobacteraceae bacterium]